MCRKENCTNCNIGITGTHNSEHNCLEDIFATYADWNNRDYKVMYLDSWNFGYLKNNETYKKKIDQFLSSNRVLDVRSNLQINLLKKYAGISVEWKKSTNPKKELDWLYSNIDDHCIAIHIDAYWCPWIPMYQKEYCDHYVLLTSITSTDLICLDPYNGNKEYTLGHSDFLSGIRGLVNLKCLPSYEEPDFRKLLLEAVDRVAGTNEGYSDFNAMENFIEEIFIYDRLKRYIDSDKGINTSALIRRLTQIANGRKKFSRLLKSIFNEVNDKVDEVDYSAEFKDLAKRWENIRNIILKMYLGGCNEVDVLQVVEKIKIIIEKESLIRDSLQQRYA